MLDITGENQPDRRPEILVCVYEDGDPVWTALTAATAEGWSPQGARTRNLGPDEPAVLASLITDALDDSDCRAVLLVGRSRRGDGFRIQMRAENRALAGNVKLSLTGPATARATAPVAEIVRALNDAGLSTDATSESEEDVGSYLLYRILTALPDATDAPAVGLLRVPMNADPAALQTALRTASSAMARHLSPLPRARLS